jgi:uncharacterized protein (DUF983 family)
MGKGQVMCPECFKGEVTTVVVGVKSSCSNCGTSFLVKTPTSVSYV